VVADFLLQQGKPVTVIVRSADKGREWEAKGAKVAVGVLEDADALRGVLAGAGGAYLLVPPGYTADRCLEDRRRITDSLATAVAQSGIPHVVLLSSIGAHWDSGTGTILSVHEAEVALTASARNLTVLRGSYFLENWAPVLGAAREQGVLPSFLMAARRIPMVATRDIGRVASESLLHPASGRQVIELAGPEEYSPEDIARAVGSVLHRSVRVEQAPLSAVVPTFRSFGFSEDAARLFEEMYGAVNSGRIVFEGKGSEFKRGGIGPAQVFGPLLQSANTTTP
jgi:uncharacterized protein YbjT (DUF2867 family)